MSNHDPLNGLSRRDLLRLGAGGIGLGLALCQRLAQRNHGAISLGNGPLTGATFDLMLPAYRGEA